MCRIFCRVKWECEHVAGAFVVLAEYTQEAGVGIPCKVDGWDGDAIFQTFIRVACLIGWIGVIAGTRDRQ